jgi:hypothetical protein
MLRFGRDYEQSLDLKNRESPNPNGYSAGAMIKQEGKVPLNEVGYTRPIRTIKAFLDHKTQKREY